MTLSDLHEALHQFDNRPSREERIEIAEASEFDLVGVGAFRTAVKVDDETVAKVSHRTVEPRSNTSEIVIWENAPTNLRRYLCPVLDYDDDHRWVKMPLCDPIEDEDYSSIFDEVQRLGYKLTDFDKYNCGLLDGRIVAVDYGNGIDTSDGEYIVSLGKQKREF